MTRCQHTSSAPIVLLILFGITQQLSGTTPLAKGGHSNDDIYMPSPSGLAKLFSSQLEEGQARVDKEQNLPQTLQEEDDELFKDVDPKTLAAVLLEALNQPGVSKKSSRAEMEEMNKGAKGEEKGQEEQTFLGSDRDRDGKQELELVMAAAAPEGKEEREREEEEERNREEEEEEQLTEKVKSRTTSQMRPVKEQPEKEAVKEQEPREEAHQEPEDEEEQLSPQEVKNLQTVLEELQSYSTATKRERESGGQRGSRGSFQDMDNDFLNNEIKPKGSQLALSKKKLKWQEEEQTKKNRPLYRGGNFMDDFDDNIKGQSEEDKEDEEDEEVLSPEEEEARAKADQEEVRRQAAEAQRAKAEEERLADIASDMLLQYMVKQDGKKYVDQSKKTSQGDNAAEDKRSEEEFDGDDDDIDPQTIDKLIEISSKLHLPADDVVDIISDVEKKKKKDAPENVPWHRVPLAQPPAPAPAPQNPAPKLSSSLTSPSKTWVKDNKAVVKQSKQDFWPKLQKQYLTYPTYSFVQKPYRGYFPIYFPPPKPKPQYYTKPTFSFNNLLGNSLDYDFGFPPKRRYRPWVQPRSRNPPPLRRNLYFSNYILPHPRTFKPVPMPMPMPKPRSAPRRRPSFYYSPPAPMVPRSEDYFNPAGQQLGNDEELENFIEKVFLKHPRMFQ